MKFPSFKNVFRKKASAAGHIIVQQPFREYSPNRNYKALSDEGYRKNVVAKRCIDYIASNVAEIQVNLFVKRVDKELTDHPVLDLLEKPNPMMCYQEYMGSLVSYFMLHGNLFSEAVYGTKVGKNPQELWVQRPDRMKVVPNAKGLPAAYTLTANGKKYTWTVDQVTGNSPILHVKTFNPLDDWYGMSFLESAAYSVDQFNQSMIWNISLMKNGARPPGAFVLERTNDPNFDGLTENQRRQIRAEIEEIYSGSENAGRPMLLEGGLTYKEMGLSPKDMDWIESKNTTTRDICLAFGVPPQLVGVPGDSTYANYEQARLAFYDNTALPLKKLICKALNRWLLPMYENGDKLQLRPDIDSIEALAPRRKAKWEMVQNSNFLSINEKRVETGYGRYETTDEPADQIFINASLIPLEFASDFGTEPLEDTEDVTGPEEEEDEDTENPEQDDADGDQDEEGKSIEVKSFNINTNAKKRAYWAQQTRKLKKQETKMRNKVAAVFVSEGRKISSALEDASPLVWELIADEIIDENSENMLKAIGTSTADTMAIFGKQVRDSAKSFTPVAEVKNSQDRFESFVRNYIKSTTAESVTQISRTTKRRLKKLFKKLQREESEGSIVDVSKEVGALYKGFTPARSLTIARTETHNASMTAQLKQAESLNIPNLKKEWIPSQDERSRDGTNGPNHVGMLGKTVELDGKFEVDNGSGVDLMEGPGDPTAPAGQIINCRCVIAFTGGQ